MYLGMALGHERVAPYYIQDASKDIKCVLSNCDSMSANFTTAV